jgi:hypothetical protein
MGAQTLIEDYQHQGNNFPECRPNNETTSNPRRVPSSPSWQRGLTNNRDIIALKLYPTPHPIVDGVPMDNHHNQTVSALLFEYSSQIMFRLEMLYVGWYGALRTVLIEDFNK